MGAFKLINNLNSGSVARPRGPSRMPTRKELQPAYIANQGSRTPRVHEFEPADESTALPGEMLVRFKKFYEIN